ncbi:MAG: hypothetical protein ACRDBM_15380 [Sporomusa sp.]
MNEPKKRIARSGGKPDNDGTAIIETTRCLDRQKPHKRGKRKRR